MLKTEKKSKNQLLKALENKQKETHAF